MGPITYGVSVMPAAPIVTDDGPVKHLLSGPRLPFTATYFGSIALTLYFAVGVSDRPFQSLVVYPCLRWHTLVSPFFKYNPSFCDLEMRHY